VVLGEKWRAAIHVLQILAWVGLVQVGATQTTTLLQAIGRTGIFFRYTLVSAICSIAGFAIGLHWGIVGVAVAYAIVNTVLIPWYIASGARAVGLPLRDLGRAISGVLQATAGMAVVLIGLRLALLDHLSAGPRLVGLIAAGIAVYVALCRSRAPEVVEEIRRARISRFTKPEVAGRL
jgi:O-antigen/teichoic acid export membrane protein